MKGDGEDKGLRDFLSLGSSGSWEREEEELKVSRDGLNMLAGGFHGRFTLKPPPAPRGFHRPKTTPTWPGMGMVFVNEESATHGSSVVAKLEQPLGADVESLTPGECWSVVLKLGKRWPAWNRTMSLPSPQGVRSALQLEGGSDHARGNAEVMLGQGSLDLLTTRALEALAQAPAGSMPAPKQTTQQFSKAKAVRDPPSEPAAIPGQSANPPTYSSRVMSATGPRTAPLTIFYDGKVNVCDNVPEDKAHLIMLFAERSSLIAPPPPAAAAEAPASSAPSTSAASPQVTPQPQATSSSHPAVVLPSHHLAPGKQPSELGSSSHRQPPESSNVPSTATTITEANTSRQLMQQSLNGPMSKRLPMARKNSLARFLDSRKRHTQNASVSESPPLKKQELEPSNAADDSSGSNPCAESKEVMRTTDAEKHPMTLS